jgi:putative spermidine/putrescine transport system ATP-binding protein
MSKHGDSARRSLELRLEGVSKSFGSVVALGRSDLTVEPGVLLSLLGPSGCGKTTTLRIIAGFEAPDSGCVLIDGEDVSLLPPNKRGLGMVFQNYSLFPHMTVGENIAFGLKMARVGAAEVKRRVGEMLELVHLSGFEERFPHQLSGGQQQRVALARSLVTNPSVLLLDEPLGALDKNLRENMQFELRRIQQMLGITTILVTHDQEEALTLSDRVVVMKNGHIQQMGTPSEVYDYPRTRFVSEFLGTSNLFEGNVGVRSEGGWREFTVAYGNQQTVLRVTDDDDVREGESLMAVRPEKITLTEHRPDGGNVLEGEVFGHVFRGSYHAYEITIPGRSEPLFVYSQARTRSGDQVFRPSQPVHVSWTAADSIVLAEDCND